MRKTRRYSAEPVNEALELAARDIPWSARKLMGASNSNAAFHPT